MKSLNKTAALAVFLFAVLMGAYAWNLDVSLRRGFSTPAEIVALLGIAIFFGVIRYLYLSRPRLKHLLELKKKGIDPAALPWHYFLRGGKKRIRGKNGESS